MKKDDLNQNPVHRLVGIARWDATSVAEKASESDRVRQSPAAGAVNEDAHLGKTKKVEKRLRGKEGRRMQETFRSLPTAGTPNSRGKGHICRTSPPCGA